MSTITRGRTLDLRPKIIFEPTEDRTYRVVVPALPEVLIEGATLEKAFQNAEEAIMCSLRARLDRGKGLPEEGPDFRIVELDPLDPFDTLAIHALVEDAVGKTTSLEDFAREEGIDLEE